MSVHARAVAAQRALYTSVQLAANKLRKRHTIADPGTEVRSHIRRCHWRPTRSGACTPEGVQTNAVACSFSQQIGR